MTILTDFRAEAEKYARQNITTAIDNLEPDVPSTINPGEEFTFDLVATNAGDPDGIAVTNVCYHLFAEGEIELIVPPETVAIARSGRPETSSQLTPGSLVTEMFLFGITEDPKALGIGDGDAIRSVKGKSTGIGPGVGELSLKVHCDPDFDELLPDNRQSKLASTTVNVV